MTESMDSYENKKQALIAQLNRSKQGGVRLDKQTSNLFRDRSSPNGAQLNVKAFNNVLDVDAQGGGIEVEGMATYEQLVDASLAQRCMPMVVPQLKSITIGGAVSGVGIESSSFKYGLVHETVREMDILIGTGEVIRCTPDNEYRDLFFGVPNSYGTLGYVLKLKVRAVPVKSYVRLEHIRHTDPEAYFQDIRDRCHQDIDFLDGSIFSPNELYITAGSFVDEAPYCSDYTFEHIYYRSIRSTPIDYLNTYDYLWRWDTDWFWCSKNVFAQNPIIRRMYGRSRLNSVFYTKIMRWNAKWGLTGMINRVLGIHAESVIQDVDVPIECAPDFLSFFDHEIGIRPVWICPIRKFDANHDFSLYPMDADKIYINFGFWDVVRSRQRQPNGHYNKKVEAKVEELGGIKSLYSESYYQRDKFWEIYDQGIYETLKAKYDPQRKFKDLYEKCVLRE